MRSILSLAIIVTSLNVFGQFSGSILYRDQYEIRRGTEFFKPLELNKAGGSVRKLEIDGPSFKISTNGTTSFKNIVYLHDENRIYYFGDRSDTLFWIDANYDTATLISRPKIELTNDSIMGMRCKKIVLLTEFTKITYYYNSALALDPRDFQSDHFQFWNEYVQYARAVPLKFMVERTNFRYTSVATFIDKKVARTKNFELPNLPRKQNRLNRK